MENVYLVGVGMTRFGRHPESTVADLTRDALTQALDDAGIGLGDLEAAYFANAGQGALEDQHMIAGQLALRAAGVEGIAIINVENACASASTALHLACSHARSGAADVVLAIGAEKMVLADKARSFAVFNGAWDVRGVDQILDNLKTLSGNRHQDEPSSPSDSQYSVFMDVYASLAKQHMRLFGTTQRQMATVASKNHWHSTFNPLAQYQKPFTVEEILAAREVVWPLTVPMCSPITDGAAAAIVCSARGLRRFGNSGAVRVRASALASGSSRGVDEYRKHISHHAANLAYEMASVGPSEISVAEVHDASAVGEIIQSENLRLCEFGDGGPAASGATPAWVDAFRSTRLEVSSARGIRSAPPGSDKSMSSCSSCVTRPARGRWTTHVLP